MKGHNPFAPRDCPKRFVAAFMLVLLLPAAVLAAPLRYCFGQDGHQAIEFAHWKGISHAVAEIENIDLPGGLSRDRHADGRSCQDRLLLPLAAKRDFCNPPRSSGDPAIASNFRFNATRCALRHPTSQFAPQNVPRPDPRLATLRTVELLN